MKRQASTQEKLLKEQVMKSLFWLGGLKYTGQLITWGITIVVIRLLSPEDYGLMAKATVCIGFLLMISELGLAAAIVQKKDVNEIEIAQAFGFVIMFNVILCLALLLSAPLIATFFREFRLIPMLRALSTILLLLPIYVIPQALLTREMDFRSKSIVESISSVISAITTLVLALRGYGVWSLVLGAIIYHVAVTVGYNASSRKLLYPKFAVKGIGDLISFGGFVISSRIVWYFYSTLDILVGGRVLTNALLGVYSVATNLSSIPIDKVAPIINQVAFPAYSKIQEDLGLVQRNLLKSLKMVSLIIFPIYWGLVVVAPELIFLFIGEKWREAVLPMQILCMILPLRTLGTLFPPLLQGIGNPKMELSNISIVSMFMFISFLLGVQWGIVGLSVAWVCGYGIGFLVLCIRSLNLIGLHLRDFLKCIRTPVFASTSMLFVVTIIGTLSRDVLPTGLLLIFKVFSGIMVFLCIVFIVQRDVLQEAVYLFKKQNA